jgi:hypothetical protein
MAINALFLHNSRHENGDGVQEETFPLVYVSCNLHRSAKCKLIRCKQISLGNKQSSECNKKEFTCSIHGKDEKCIQNFGQKT